MNYGAIEALPNPGYGPATGVQEDNILAQKMTDLMQNQFGLKPKMQDLPTRLRSRSGITT